MNLRAPYILLVFCAVAFASDGLAQSLLYADVKSIIDARCVPCHSAGGAAEFLPFEALEQIRGNQDRMADAIGFGEMPMGDPDFGFTPDGETLILWLTTGADLIDEDEPGPPSLIERDPRELTFADLEPILRANCQGCHAPGGRMERRPLTNLSEVRRNARDAWEMLDKAEMPPGNPNFAFSIEGRALAGWLRYGRDVTWRDNNGDDDDDGDDDD